MIPEIEVYLTCTVVVNPLILTIFSNYLVFGLFLEYHQQQIFSLAKVIPSSIAEWQ